MSSSSISIATYRRGRFVERAFFADAIIKIGSSKTCALRLPQRGSPLHAIIEVTESDALVIDLGNAGGTTLDGQPVTKASLSEGNRISVGETEFVVEQLALSVAPARPSGEGSSNPFAAALVPPDIESQSPLDRAAGIRTPLSNASAANYTYELLKSGPHLPDHELETDAGALEVIISWGHYVLHTDYLCPPRSYFLGNGSDGSQVDFVVPEHALPEGRTPIVIVDGDETFVVTPNGGRASLKESGDSGDEFRGDALGQEAPAPSKPAQIALERGTEAHMRIGDFLITVRSTRAGRPTPKGLAAGFDYDALSYFGLSVTAIGGLLLSMAYFAPPLELRDETQLAKERLLLIQQYLGASAEREREQAPPENTERTDQSQGGTGEAAKAESGSLGAESATQSNKAYAVKGRHDHPDPHLARQANLAEASRFGMIGLLNAGFAGDPKAPTAPWGRTTSLGVDDLSARGNMWGEEIGESIGNGLGLSGIGEGGGGLGEGVGLDSVGGLGHGAGTGRGHRWGPGGFASSTGRMGGSHVSVAPDPRKPVVTAGGHLPAEVIRRVVRQNFGRFRFCYEQGLAKNPNLEGRVAVRFVIGRDGAVSNVGNGGSDMPDSGVVSCTVSAFYGLSFPPPESGVVKVTYPIMFQPG